MQFKGYELDGFQQRAIEAIDEGRSIIVSAPTGAGKTVIAEYAIEKFLREGKQIIYTAPIKALSNQKFRDFSHDYAGKIGIMTGDVIINPEAPVLIMTTEIFRNIIFDNDDRLDSVQAVIFDEIHYIHDAERGTVWEESIIFAPQHIMFICLSATIPNFEEFSSWMQKVRDLPIEAIVETHRPVPLKVNLFLPGYGVRPPHYLKKLETPDGKARGRFRIDNAPLLRHLRESDQLPVLYFVFSRMGCREQALRHRGLKLVSSAESKRILDEYDGLVVRFEIRDRPGVDTMRELLANGIAFHHAGILPTLKEIIERLYTLGMIKLLFTTETFAVGVNMPARTVVFESLMKNDGHTFRYLTAREFQQMSGRAGRRGIDPVGYVYSIVNPVDFRLKELEKTFAPDAEDVESRFSLSYSSILNLFENYGDRIFEVCHRSFNNYKNLAQIDELSKKARFIEEELDTLREGRCFHGDFGKMEAYMKVLSEYQGAERLMRKEQGKGRAVALNEMSRLRSQMGESMCSRCKRKHSCRDIMRKITSRNRSLEDARAMMRDADERQAREIEKRLALLRKLDYIDHTGLLPRGKIASQIFGYELQLTELYFEGFFNNISPEEINVLTVAALFESRRNTTFTKLKDAGMNDMLHRANRVVERLRRKESELKIPTPVKSLDVKFCRAALEWCRGCDFDDLKNFTSEDPGDLVRTLRLTVDFLRQMKRAIPDPGFRDKLGKCVELIYRDVVDAEAQLKTEL